MFNISVPFPISGESWSMCVKGTNFASYQDSPLTGSFFSFMQMISIHSLSSYMALVA